MVDLYFVTPEDAVNVLFWKVLEITVIFKNGVSIDRRLSTANIR